MADKIIRQSYVFTTAKYHSTIYEKRIFYMIVDLMQPEIDGKKVGKNYNISQDLYGEQYVTIPIRAILGDDNENHSQVKKAIKSLQSKLVEFDIKEKDGSKYILFENLIERSEIHLSGYVKFRIPPKTYEAFVALAKGITPYNLAVAMNFKSVYTMRFYELLSNQKNNITFTFEQLKGMFGIEDKYKEGRSFVRVVVKPSQKELNEKSPVSFAYKLLPESGKKTAIMFSPYLIPENEDDNAILQQIKKPKESIIWNLDKNIIDYLKENFNFTANQISNNLQFFNELQDNNINLLYAISDVRQALNRSKKRKTDLKNPQGYLINSLKKLL